MLKYSNFFTIYLFLLLLIFGAFGIAALLIHLKTFLPNFNFSRGIILLFMIPFLFFSLISPMLKGRPYTILIKRRSPTILNNIVYLFLAYSVISFILFAIKNFPDKQPDTLHEIRLFSSGFISASLFQFQLIYATLYKVIAIQDKKKAKRK